MQIVEEAGVSSPDAVRHALKRLRKAGMVYAREDGDWGAIVDEPEHQERSAMAKLAALREQFGKAELDEDPKLDADLKALAHEVRKHAPVLGTRGGLEERLWSALDRSVGVLEESLDRSVGGEATNSPTTRAVEALLEHSFAVRNIAETLDRLGMLKPPPVEAPEPRTWLDVRDGAAEGEARGATLPHHGPGVRRYDDEDDGDPS